MSRKIKILLIVLLFVVIVVGLGIYIAFTPNSALPGPLRYFSYMLDNKLSQEEIQNNTTEKTIIYHDADFSENIYNDEVFVDLMSLYALEYVDGDIKYKLPASELERYGGKLAVFFYDYFTDIRNGDSEAYNSYFDKEAFRFIQKADDFTMQQIYEISIEPLNIQPQLNEEDYDWILDLNIEPIYVNVSYKIRKNNGSFRLGIDSDVAKPQLYILYETKDSYKIINIVEFTSN